MSLSLSLSFRKEREQLSNKRSFVDILWAHKIVDLDSKRAGQHGFTHLEMIDRVETLY